MSVAWFPLLDPSGGNGALDVCGVDYHVVFAKLAFWSRVDQLHILERSTSHEDSGVASGWTSFGLYGVYCNC